MSQVSNTVTNSSSDSISFFLQLLRSCEQSQMIYCGVDSTNRDKGSYTLFFNSSSVAKEAADVLRGDWDGTNAVTIRQYEVVAIREDNSIVVEYADEAVKFELKEQEIEYCQQGQFCYINTLSMRPKTKASSGKSIILSEKIMQTLEGLWERTSVELPSQSAESQ